jgi:phage tail protein X
MNEIAYYIHHVTTQDDRLDLISFKYFGNVSMVSDIVAINPNLPLTDTLPTGLTVNVPVYKTTKPTTQAKPGWLT